MSSNYTYLLKVCAHIAHMSRSEMTRHQQKLNTWHRHFTPFSEFRNSAIIGGRCLLVVLLPCVAFNQYWRYLVCLSRATVGVDRICSLWGSAGLPEKEPWIKWYVLQRPGYQTTNKSYLTAADEVCLANRRWNVLFVIDTSEWCNCSFSNVVRE